MTDAISLLAQASDAGCVSGDSAGPTSVPQLGSELDPVFVNAIALWNGGADTSEIACELHLPESSAHWLVNEYLNAKYKRGWGSKHDARTGGSAC